MLLEVNDLTRQFPGAAGTVRALDGVSLSLDAGQFLAVQGASGCGKTTLLLVVGGLLKPDDGKVQLAGEDPYELPAGRRAGFRSRHIGFVFQQFHLVPYLTVFENIVTPALAGGLRDGRERAWELIRILNLEDRAGHLPAMLSTGQRQRTAIARALLRRPKLLLADEPTGNLDHQNARIVLEHLADFAAQGGAVLLMTHDPQAAQYAGRHLSMSQGKLPPSHETKP